MNFIKNLWASYGHRIAQLWIVVGFLATIAAWNLTPVTAGDFPDAWKFIVSVLTLVSAVAVYVVLAINTQRQRRKPWEQPQQQEQPRNSYPREGGPKPLIDPSKPRKE